MSSRSARDLALSGFKVIGPMARTAISGFQARGHFRRKQVFSGLQVIGIGTTASTYGTKATGDPSLASMAELTTDSASPVSASIAASLCASITTSTVLR